MLHDYYSFEKEKGCSLKSLGIDGYCFKKSDALTAIELLKKDEIPILGGDVFKIENNTLKLTYDNWYYEQNPDESLKEFASNSAQYAKNYISKYSAPSESDILFSIVF